MHPFSHSTCCLLNETAAGLSAFSPAAVCAAHCVWTRRAAARRDETLMTFHRSRRIAGIPRTDALSALAVEEAGPKPVQEAPLLRILVSPDSLHSQSSTDEQEEVKTW